MARKCRRKCCVENRKYIANLEEAISSTAAALKFTEVKLQTARADAFKDFAKNSGIITDATDYITLKLAEKLVEQIITPVFANWKLRGITADQAHEISQQFGRVFGPEYYNYARQTLQSLRRELPTPIADFEMVPKYDTDRQIISGYTKAIEYCIEVKV